MENEEKKKRIRNGVIIALILLLAISLIGGTFARYSATGKADARDAGGILRKPDEPSQWC